MAGRAQGHHIEEEWEHQVAILEKQSARLRQPPTAGIVAMMIHEKLLGLASTMMAHRMTVYGEFYLMTEKSRYVVAIPCRDGER